MIFLDPNQVHFVHKLDRILANVQGQERAMWIIFVTVLEDMNKR